MKKIFAIILAALMLLTLVSCKKDEGEDGDVEATISEKNEIYEDEDSGDKFTYAINQDGTYDIVDFEAKDLAAHKVEIPSVIDNIEVTGIAKDAFKGCNSLSEIVIPDSIEYIEDYAFWGCTYLEVVEIPDSVTAIGIGAFESCSALRSLTLSAALKAIPEFAFRHCVSLEAVVIPATVEEIGDGAFWNCAALKEVKVPAAVKSVGDCGFYGCAKLTKATFDGAPETFGEYVFGAGNDALVIVAAEESTVEAYAALYNLSFQKVVVE